MPDGAVRTSACWRTHGLHHSCLYSFFQKIFYSEKVTPRHPMKIATIRLQWNPKAKMMCVVTILTANFLPRPKRRLPETKRDLSMKNTLKRAMKLAPWLSVATILAAVPALAQAPSQAQRDAIKSQCRSDYMAHCASVPPGGEASLQCLQKNMASLSSSCQGAVRAVEAPAAAKPAETAAPKAAAPAAATTAAPKAAEPKAAAATPAGQPSSAQISAIRSACRSDYPKVCAGVPTGGAPALQCLEKNKAKLSAGCEKAVSAASGGGAATATAAPAAGAAGAAAAPATPTVIVLRPLR